MPKNVAIGIQDFEKLRSNNCFYVDKTGFIKEWWESNDEVTLITRPRRFGKTLLLNTVDRFLSNQYENQAKYFEGLKVWEDAEMRELQGSRPVIFISLADVKEPGMNGVLSKLSDSLFRLYNQWYFVLEQSEALTEAEKKAFISGTDAFGDIRNPDRARIINSLQSLSGYLCRHYGQKVVILLDEYDTPMQEAYVSGYWDEITALFRSFFNATFKTNPYLDRALMTGISRVSRESMFSDLNNLTVVSTTTDLYTDAFGFTESEVFNSMDEYGYQDKEGVKYWYDGFAFGNMRNIYNPWSIINYLREGEFKPYWINTSGNALAGKLIREGSTLLKKEFEDLLQGRTIHNKIDEQIVFSELGRDSASVWSLLLASGYLKVIKKEGEDYELDLTNYEVRKAFERMVHGWFADHSDYYNEFVKALLKEDLEAMNYYMNDVALSTFSSFDSGTRPASSEPERFYHGFVLGLLVDLKDRYIITSNRESGFGRYDVILEPRDKAKEDGMIKYDGIILEFKVHNPKKEETLEDTVAAAHAQIEEKAYARALIDHGVPEECIRSYGFAFRGKEVLIG